MIVEIPDKQYFYPAEAATILKMHRVTLYRKISEGLIEVEYISSHITIIPRTALIAYLESVVKQRTESANTVA